MTESIKLKDTNTLFLENNGKNNLNESNNYFKLETNENKEIIAINNDTVDKEEKNEKKNEKVKMEGDFMMKNGNEEHHIDLVEYEETNIKKNSYLYLPNDSNHFEGSNENSDALKIVADDRVIDDKKDSDLKNVEDQRLESDLSLHFNKNLKKLKHGILFKSLDAPQISKFFRDDSTKDKGDGNKRPKKTNKNNSRRRATLGEKAKRDDVYLTEIQYETRRRELKRSQEIEKKNQILFEMHSQKIYERKFLEEKVEEENKICYALNDRIICAGEEYEISFLIPEKYGKEFKYIAELKNKRKEMMEDKMEGFLKDKSKKIVIENYIRSKFPDISPTKVIRRINKLNQCTKIIPKVFNMIIKSSSARYLAISIYDNKNTCIFQNVFRTNVNPNSCVKSLVEICKTKFFAGEKIKGCLKMYDVYENQIRWDQQTSERQLLWLKNVQQQAEDIEVSQEGIFNFEILKEGNYKIEGNNNLQTIELVVCCGSIFKMFSPFFFQIYFPKNKGEMSLSRSLFKLEPKEEIYNGGNELTLSVDAFDCFGNRCSTLGSGVIFNGKHYIFQNNVVKIKLENNIEGKHGFTVRVSNNSMVVAEIEARISSPDPKFCELLLKTGSEIHVGDTSIFHLVLRDEDQKEWDPISSVISPEFFFEKNIKIRALHNKKKTQFKKIRLSPGVW